MIRVPRLHPKPPHPFELAAQMQEALLAEDYEAAARIRDVAARLQASGHLNQEAVRHVLASRNPLPKLAFRPAT